MRRSSASSALISSNRSKTLFLAGATVVIVVFALLSLTWGTSVVGWDEVLSMVRGREVSSSAHAILFSIRIPRAVAALLVGACLSVSGLFLQAVLNNVMASPSTLGINSGASFAVVLGAVFVPFSLTGRLVTAFLGAVLTAALVSLLASRAGHGPSTLILAGVAISGVMSAGVDILTTLNADLIMDKQMFSIGGLSNVHPRTVVYFVGPVVLLLLVSLFFSHSLNVLLLGDEVATSLGVNVKTVRMLCLLVTSMLAACAVSLGGLISFVGLLVPHGLRALYGNDYRWLLPGSIVIGAGFLLLCDTMARVLFLPYDLPVAILLSLIGAPFFLLLVLRRPSR